MRRRNPKIADKTFKLLIRFENESIFFDFTNRIAILTTFLKVFKSVYISKYICSYF